MNALLDDVAAERGLTFDQTHALVIGELNSRLSELDKLHKITLEKVKVARAEVEYHKRTLDLSRAGWSLAANGERI